MLTRIHLRPRTALLALAVGLALTIAGVLASGALATSETPVVAGVPLSAPLNESRPAYDGYQGWGTVVADGNTSGRFAAGAWAGPQTAVAAWRWNARFGWQYLPYNVGYSGHRVYIYPYAAGWSWTWTEARGWTATQTSNLIIGYRPVAIAT